MGQPTATMPPAVTDDAPRDRVGMEVLDLDACWQRLRGEPLGRLAVQVGGHLHLVPINHAVRNREILFVSAPGTKLHHAMHEPGAEAVFEVDGYDGAAHTGWSVIVRGHLHPVVDLVEHTSLDVRGRPTWLEGHHDRTWVRLVPEQVSGRVLGPR